MNKYTKRISACFVSGFSLLLFTLDCSAALVPDYYSEPGINPNRDYVNQNFSEYIDPFTGKLQLHYVDLYIPGNGGMDVKVQRSYTSLDGDLTNQDPQSIMGFGWTVHYGRIKRAKTSSCSGNDLTTSNDNPVLQLPDGKEEVFFYRKSTSLSGGYEYVSKNNWIANCSGSSYEGDSWTVKSPDGYVYAMSKKIQPTGDLSYWYTKTITDASGNVVTVKYLGDNYDLYHGYNQKPFISSVSGQGLTVTFTYKNQSPTNYQNMRLQTVKANSQTVTYAYDQVGSSTDWRLVSVDLPGAAAETGAWNYVYLINENNLFDSTPGNLSIKEIDYPKGGKIVYTYQHNYFDSSSGVSTTSVHSKKTSGPGISSGTWTYSYQKSAGSNDFDTTTITAPDGTYTYKHYGYDAAMPGEVWRIGLLYQKQVSGSGATQTEVYDWGSRIISDEKYNGPRSLNDTNIRAPVLDKKTITIGADSFISDYQNFDPFGNPQAVVETGAPGGISKTTNYTYFNNSAKWIIGKLKDETVLNAATVSGSAVHASILRTYYSAGNKTGKLQVETKYGVASTYDYHTNGGDLYTERDARGYTTTYSNYYRGTARSVNYPDTTSVTREVNGTGTVQWEENGRGIRTYYTYDDLNRVASVNLPAPKTDAVVSWPSVRNRVVTRGSYRESTSFDGFGNVISITRQDSSKGISIATTAAYDSLNRLIFESYPGSTIGTRFTFDALGRARDVYHGATSGNTGEAGKHYDYLSGNRVKVTDERNNVYTYTYRAYGDPDKKSLIKIEAPENIVVDVARNRLDLIESVTLGGKVRQYAYDSHLFLQSVTEPETGATVYTRDAVGNPKTRRVGVSGDTCYVHDSRNRLEKIYFPPANCGSPPATPDIQYVYDGNSNVKQVINHTDSVTREFVYDATDNLDLSTLKIALQSLSVDYVIDSLDHIQSIQYPSGRIVAYNPDALGRPTRAGAYVDNVTYHPSGQPERIEFANQVVATATQTSRQWTDVLKTTGALSEVLIGWDYDYDKVGNVDYITDIKDSTYNIDPAYDRVNRLSSIMGPWGGTHATNRIAYDTRGNIESKTIGSVSLSYAYDQTTDRLSTVSGTVAKTYQYDDYGNISSDGNKSFVYSDNSVLTRATGSSLAIDYLYDGDKRLVKSTKDGRSTYFFYDTADKLLGEYDSNLNLQKEYVYLGSQLVATIAEVPDIPASVSITTPDAGGNHTVSWGAAAGNVTHYEVVQSVDPSDVEAGALVYSGSALSYGLSASDGTYYYFVRACNGSECGDYQPSGRDCAVIGANSAPCVPGPVSVASSSSTGTYGVSWALPEGAVTNYQIQESLRIDFATIKQTYNAANSPLNVSGKGDGTYYYRVRACNAGNCSPYAAASNGIKVLVAPNAPANLTAPAQVAASSYTLSWSAVGGTVTAYRLYEATNSGFSGETLVYQGTARSYGVTGKSADATYYYRVVACNQGACSGPTESANAVVVRHAPTPPATLSVPLNNNTGDYSITWQSASGTVTGYELQESGNATFGDAKGVYTGMALTAGITAKLDGTFYYRVRACNDFACSDYLAGANSVAVSNSPYTATLIVIITGLLLQ